MYAAICLGPCARKSGGCPDVGENSSRPNDQACQRDPRCPYPATLNWERGTAGGSQECDHPSMVRFDDARQVLWRGPMPNRNGVTSFRPSWLWEKRRALFPHACPRDKAHPRHDRASAPSRPTSPRLVLPFLAKLLRMPDPSLAAARSTSIQLSIGEGAMPREERSSCAGRAVWRKKSFPGSTC